MAGEFNSKLEVGKSADFMEVNAGLTRRLGLKIGKVTGVDTKNNTMSLEWVWPYRGAINNVDIGSPYWGFRSGIRFTPEVGSLLVIGYAKDKVVPLSYLPPSNFAQLLASEKDNNGVKTYSREISEGDIQIRSSKGAEIYLDDLVHFGDKDSNAISVDPKTGNVHIHSLNLIAENEAGYIKMGQVSRAKDGTHQVITDDGKEATAVEGGNALNELKINIKELSDSSSIVTTQENPSIAEITVGTLVNKEGLKVINPQGNEIVCDIKFASGARVQVDKKGNININEANALKPTEESNGPDRLQILEDEIIYNNTPQQRAAREGDRIAIPLSFATQPDMDHPNMANKVLFNISQLSQFASMIMSPAGPCTFVPATPDVKLLGEIVQGANGVFIGSLDKTKEIEEYSIKNDK